jgi:nucleotide-binding universal stress UspA family protein
MIPKTKKILVTTDCSDVGNNAIPYAYALVDPGGEVHVIHVIEHRNIPSPLIAHYSTDDLNDPEKRKEAAQRVEAGIGKLIPKEAEDKKVDSIVAAVFHPDVAEGILKEIDERKVDMVVIGDTGHSALSSLLLGSVAEEVLRDSTIPVLIVPGE